MIVDEMHESIVQMPAELGLEVDYFPNISIEEVKAKGLSAGQGQGLIS